MHQNSKYCQLIIINLWLEIPNPIMFTIIATQKHIEFANRSENGSLRTGPSNGKANFMEYVTELTKLCSYRLNIWSASFRSKFAH